MPTGKELVDNGRITAEKLVTFTMGKKITAFDNHTNKPINWEQLKADINQIGELAKKPGIGNHPGPRMISRGFDSSGNHIPGEPPRTIQQDRLIPESGVEWQNHNYLLHRLHDARKQTKVSPEQLTAVDKGWGRLWVEPIVLTALYKEEELERILSESLPPYLDKNHPYYCPELAVLVEAWLEFYEEKTAQLIENQDTAPIFQEWIKKWIEANAPALKTNSGNLLGKDGYLVKILNGKELKLREKLYNEHFPSN